MALKSLEDLQKDDQKKVSVFTFDKKEAGDYLRSIIKSKQDEYSRDKSVASTNWINLVMNTLDIFLEDKGQCTLFKAAAQKTIASFSSMTAKDKNLWEQADKKHNVSDTHSKFSYMFTIQLPLMTPLITSGLEYGFLFGFSPECLKAIRDTAKQTYGFYVLAQVHNFGYGGGAAIPCKGKASHRDPYISLTITL